MDINQQNIEEIEWNHARYMLEKLDGLINELVCGKGDAKWRLRRAVPNISKIIPGMFPDIFDIRENINQARRLLLKYYNEEEFIKLPKNSFESIYDGTISRIRNETGAKIIKHFFSAWLELRDLVHDHMKV